MTGWSGAWVPIIQQSFMFLCVGYRTFLVPFTAFRSYCPQVAPPPLTLHICPFSILLPIPRCLSNCANPVPQDSQEGPLSESCTERALAIAGSQDLAFCWSHCLAAFPWANPL